MRRLLATLIFAAALTSCSDSEQAEGGTSTVTVFAAASLTESFTELAEGFEQSNPGVQVQLSFGASSSLAQQILQGAPADVFASASGATMQQVVDGGEAEQPRTFATNSLALVTPTDDPGRVTTLQDLGRPGVKVAVCAPEVPCGAAAEQLFIRAGVVVTPVTLEQDVKATLAKVVLGEVDAGIVYVTDARSAGDQVRQVELPSDVTPTTDYPLAVLTRSAGVPAAQQFADFVLSTEGQAVLADAGFGPP